MISADAGSSASARSSLATLQAILQHFSPSSYGYPPSEANAVVLRFQQLSVADKQAVLDFLRSL
jgi:hypothetical protein